VTPDESDEDGDAESTDEETEAEPEPETESDADTESEAEEATGATGGEAAGQQHQRAGASAGGFLGTREESDLVKEWVIFVAATLGLAGLGIGLQFFLFDVIDEALFSWSGGSGAISSGTFALSMVALSIAGVGAVVSSLLGVYLGWTLDIADDLAYKASGLSAVGGVFLLFFVCRSRIPSIARSVRRSCTQRRISG